MGVGNDINKYLKRMKNGQGGLEELFKAVSGRVRYIAYKYLTDKSLAGDVVMNTFEKIIKNIDSFDETQSGSAWIGKIAQNEAYALNLAEAKHEHEQLDDISDTVACTADNQSSPEFTLDFYNALKRIDPTDAQIIECRIIYGDTFQQIADATGMPVGSVFRRYHQALKKITKEIL